MFPSKKGARLLRRWSKTWPLSLEFGQIQICTGTACQGLGNLGSTCSDLTAVLFLLGSCESQTYHGVLVGGTHLATRFALRYSLAPEWEALDTGRFDMGDSS